MRTIGRVTDNSPLMQIGFDSSLNNKLTLGNKFNKKIKIDNASKEYMSTNIDLSFPDVAVQKRRTLPVDKEIPIGDVQELLAEQLYGNHAGIRKHSKMTVNKDVGKIQN